MRGGYWVMGIGVAIRFLGFVKSLVFANFLLVQDLGLLAIAMMLIEILGVFFETGFNEKLVQERKEIRTYLDTAWTIHICRGLVMFLILFAAAPIAASLKVPPEKFSLTVNVIRSIGFVLFLASLENVGTVYLQKELNFPRIFLLRVPPVLIDLSVSALVLFFFRSIWGYVAGRFASVLVQVALSYSLCPYRPRFCLDWQKAAQMWRFGKWIFGLSVLNFLISEGDDFFVWGYLGVSSLALYRYAFRFSNLPATDLTNTLSQVTFPAYSKIQDDIPRLREAYLKVLRVTAFFAFLASGLIFSLGPDFVRLFLKADMHPMIPAMQIMVFKGLFRSLGATRGPLFLALGKLKIHFYFQVIRLVVLAVLIYPLTSRWGIEGTAVATLLIAVLVSPFGFWLSCRWLNCPPWRMLEPSLIPLVSFLVTISILLFLRSATVRMSPFLFVGHFLLALICYGGTALLLDCLKGFQLLSIFKEQLRVLVKNK
ncbi:MAG TPA: lipopolysaccharide biosynthesis protein [Anaerohalosphaeraceae bacterium]|nr:lipopolysaccharide biosynthesis protein [Anaerohalosphaeraceae bacterium]HOL88080.1 lipopolysaccharide biosynthesis protein [Anaerohalosphaeraceae bacterium]HPP55328.1 lipopolysaccharide biosynthesis protein [Anaerohalosphaeraceae bacterium]